METSRGVAKIRTEVERLIRLLDLRVGAFNVEVRFNAKGEVHLLEFGPRNGGNWMPEAIRAATGVDLISYSVEAALGNDCSQLKQVEPQAAIATYMLHAEQEGRFERVVIDDRLGAEVPAADDSGAAGRSGRTFQRFARNAGCAAAAFPIDGGNGGENGSHAGLRQRRCVLTYCVSVNRPSHAAAPYRGSEGNADLKLP